MLNNKMKSSGRTLRQSAHSGQAIIEYIVVLASLVIVVMAVGSIVDLLAGFNASQSAALRSAS